MFDRVKCPATKPAKKKKAKPKADKPEAVVTEEQCDRSADHRLPMALSVSLLAKELCISEKTAYELVHQPDFPSLKVKGRYIVNTKRLQDWLDQHCLAGYTEQTSPV